MNPPIRFRSLDALRGLTILGMAWSGMLPDSLPAWMYHAQIPPPNHEYSPEVFGITWVDLVFPFFLFSMGAAIPLAISNRLQKDPSEWSVVKWLGQRLALLYAFSIFGEHLRPGEWSSIPTIGTWLISILGFGLLILMFGRWPASLPSRYAKALTWVGWVGASSIVLFHIYPDGLRGFENSRNDIILMVLANVAFSGGLIWLATRSRPWIRFAIMAAIFLVFVNQSASGSVAQAIWNFTPLQFFDLGHWPYARFVPIFYHFEYQKYLLIVLPGAVCGDLMLKASGQEKSVARWSGFRSGLILALSSATILVALVGLFSRQVTQCGWLLMVCVAPLIYITKGARGPIETLIAQVCRVGALFLILGLLAEPLGGGIRKDPTTASYFLVSSGLAFFALAALEATIDILQESHLTKFLSLVGMNPILGYAAITNLVMGLSGLTGYSDRLGAGVLVAYPWVLAMLDGGLKTLMVGMITALFTEKRFYLRT